MAKKPKQRANSLWMRLKQKPKNVTLIGPQTGRTIIALPEAWPKPDIPLWRDLEYRNKLPLPNWHSWKLTAGPMNQGFDAHWPGALFDSWDPNNSLYDTDYHPLHDRALLNFFHNRRDILLRQNLITPDGQVVTTLREYNQWRRHLFRYQHQLIIKKAAIARRDELCDMIRGFISDLRKSSLTKPVTKSLYDITDEEADPKYNIGEEHERLLVELSKLHDLCKQVRVENLTYMRFMHQEKLAERERQRRSELLDKITKKDLDVNRRRYYYQVDLRAKNKVEKADAALGRRMKYQQELEEQDEQAQDTIRSRTGKNVEMWKEVYKKLHEKNRPKLPSESKVRRDTQASAGEILRDVLADVTDPSDHSIENVASEVLGEVLDESTYERRSTVSEKESVAVELPTPTGSSAHSVSSKATNGSAISLPLKSAMSKHTGESSKSTSSSQRHIAFTPSAGDEPLEPTATSSLKKLDHSDVPALKKVLSCARAGNQQVETKSKTSMCISPNPSIAVLSSKSSRKVTSSHSEQAVVAHSTSTLHPTLDRSKINLSSAPSRENASVSPSSSRNALLSNPSQALLAAKSSNQPISPEPFEDKLEGMPVRETVSGFQTVPSSTPLSNSRIYVPSKSRFRLENSTGSVNQALPATKSEADFLEAREAELSSRMGQLNSKAGVSEQEERITPHSSRTEVTGQEAIHREETASPEYVVSIPITPRNTTALPMDPEHSVTDTTGKISKASHHALSQNDLTDSSRKSPTFPDDPASQHSFDASQINLRPELRSPIHPTSDHDGKHHWGDIPIIVHDPEESQSSVEPHRVPSTASSADSVGEASASSIVNGLVEGHRTLSGVQSASSGLDDTHSKTDVTGAQSVASVASVAAATHIVDDVVAAGQDHPDLTDAKSQNPLPKNEKNERNQFEIKTAPSLVW